MPVHETGRPRAPAILMLIPAAMTVLLTTKAAAAAVREVGCGGPYIAIQAAIDDSVNIAGDDEVRVCSGVYHERLTVPSTMVADRLVVSGGWDPGFTSQNPDPAATLIDGDAIGNVVILEPHGGELIFENFLLVNGLSTGGGGGGILIRPRFGAAVTVRRNHIAGNVEVVPTSAAGGGVSAYLQDMSTLDFSDNIVGSNTSESTSSSAAAGGMDLGVDDDAVARVGGNMFTDNIVRTLSSADGEAGGLRVAVFADGEAEVSDNLVASNRLEGIGPAGGTGVTATAGTFSVAPTARLTLRRNVVVGNVNARSATSDSFQLDVRVYDTATATLSDGVVAGGDQDGMSVLAGGTGAVHVVNHSLGGSVGIGLELSGNGATTSTLENTVLWANGVDLVLFGAVGTAANLVGADPEFIDLASGDLSVAPTSATIDAGAAAPAGGLGPMDAHRCPRVSNGAVDQGAYEQGSVFCGGFTYGSGQRWSAVVY